VTGTLELPVEPRVELPDTPYVGLVPFGERDAPFFFGRERERRLIANNLIASRLTLLYGASGVGKSSVLRAGVAHDIRQIARRELAQGRVPEQILVVFSEWRDPPLPLLAAAIEEAVGETLGEAAPEPPPPTERLDILLGEWVRRIDAVPSAAGAERRTRLLIVLDQFEEYFLYHWQNEDTGMLGEELPRTLGSEGLRANFAISIREDAYSQLDRFKGRIPNLFESYLRIRHLDQEAARRAVTLPVRETWNGLLPAGERPYEIDDDLVDEVLRQVRTGSFVLGQTGGGSVGEATERRVEAPYLQRVMRRLWLETVAAGEHRLSLARLTGLGGAEAIVRSHLDDAMAILEPRERELAARIFHQLVTPEGTKIAHTVGALSSYAEVEPDELAPTLKTLSDGRILLPVDPPAGQQTPRYEIYHDVLAAPILEWCAAHVHGLQEAERREDERRAQRTMRNRAVAGVLAVGLAVSIGLVVWALVQRNDALRQGRLARSQQLANTAITQLDIDPQRSTLLALEAVHTAPTTQAEDALRAALAASHLRHVLAGDTAGVVSAAYTRDGKRILTASGDGTARLWDASTGRTLHIFRTSGALQQAAIDATGSRIAAASRRAGPFLWNARTGRPIRLQRPPAGASRVAFSPNGTLVAAAGEAPPGLARAIDIRVWRAAHGSPVQTFHGHTKLVYHVEFSPDGRHLVTASADGTARIWTLGRSKGIVLQHGKTVNDARFSPDGERVVTASWGGNVRVWTVDGSAVDSFPLDGRALSAAFSPSGDLVAAGSTDRNVHVWSLRGNRAAVLRGHTGAVSSVAFSQSGELVSASADGTARVWDVRTDASPAILRGHAGAVRAAAFSPDGKQVVTASEDHTARIWDVSPLPIVATLRVPAHKSSHASSVGAVFSPDGRYLLVRRGFDGARVYDAAGRLVATLRVRGGPLASGAFSPDSSLVATATATGPAQVWRLPSGRLVHQLRGHKPFNRGGGELLLIRRVGFSPDGKFLLTAGFDGTARIWDVATWKTRHVLRQPRQQYLKSATFSPDGRLVATAGWGSGRVGIWDSETGRLVRALRTRGAQLCASFSPDSKLLVTCDTGGVARIWDVGSGERLLALHGHTGFVLSGVFSPDGRLVATTGSDGTARVWDTATGAVLAVVNGIRGFPAVFSADGSLLAAAGSIVEARTGGPIVNVSSVGHPIVSAFGPDGSLVATMGFDGVGGLFRCDLCRPLPQLVELAKTYAPRGLTGQERELFVGG